MQSPSRRRSARGSRRVRPVHGPAQRARRAALPAQRGCLRHMESGARAHARAAGERGPRRAARPLLADGFVYEMVLRHEQQHSETILQTLQIMTSEPYEPPARRGSRPTADPLAARWRSCRPGRSRWAPGARLRVRQRAPPARVRRGGVPDRPRAGHERRHARVRRGRRLRAAGALGAEGWAWREREGVDLPRYWARARRRLRGALVRRTSAPSTRRSRCATCPGTRPTPTRAGRASACRRRRSGRRRPHGTRQPATAGPSPWGEQPANERVANLDQLAFGCAPSGAYAGGESACGMRQAPATCGSGPRAASRPTAAFARSPTASTRRSSSAGPTGCCAGGSWATQPDAVSTTFRNWDHPERRQIFAGFRCAADAEEQA